VIGVRWWSNTDGALVPKRETSNGREAKGKLPCLHLPNGDLLDPSESSKWLTKTVIIVKVVEEEEKEEKEEDVMRPILNNAFTSLVTTSLLPSVLAALYLSPATSHPSCTISPTSARPILSSIVHYFTSVAETNDIIAEIQDLRSVGKSKVMSKEGLLDLEIVEREGVECLKTLEIKMKEQGIPGWFGGAS
jgi:hypothetical protein